MKKQHVFRKYLLSAAIAAVPGTALAADQSTVAAELQKIYQANGQVMPAADHTPAADVVLVQHTQRDPATTDEKSDRRQARKNRPGILKRFFQRIGGDEADVESAQMQPGEPAPAIPKPPPIVFDDSVSSQRRPGAGIPARSVGFQQQKMGTPPAVPGVSAADPGTPNGGRPAQLNGNAAGGGSRTAQAGQRTIRRPAQDGFIDPFDAEEPVVREDILLDLDSLIQDTTAAMQKPQAAADSSSTEQPSEADSNVPTPPSAVAEAEEQGAEATADSKGPFTGYQLDSEDNLLASDRPEPETSGGADDVTANTAGSDSESVSARTDASGTDTADTDTAATETAATETAGGTSRNPQDLPGSAVELPPVETSADIAETKVAEIHSVATTEPAAEQPAAEQPANKAADVSALNEDNNQGSAASATAASPSSAAAIPGAADLAPLKQLDDRSRREQQRYRIMARTGQVGFKGFCPVALRDYRDLVDSREQYSAEFGRQTYYFSSDEAKKVFESAPARYAPAAGGSDPVLLVNTGEDVPGALDFSLWYRDRLYMFRSRETQQIFSKDPARYADQY
ncbi:MAG: hypothetical protein RIK87_28420 [Fuerstiella sp.]